MNRKLNFTAVMERMTKTAFCSWTAGLLLSPFAGAQSGPLSSSASYELLQGLPGGGGGPASNGTETILLDASVGDAFLGGASNLTASQFQEKGGLTGNFYDVASLAVSATPPAVDEGGARQLEAEATMDDETTLDVAESLVLWSVVSGPITGISMNGLAAAGLVFENTPATLQGTYQSVDGQAVLTVLDADPDNFPPVAGDGIDDHWQFNFFDDDSSGSLDATEAAKAGPAANPDADSDDNLREFLFGFSPVDGLDFFQLTLAPFSAPGTADLRLNKLIPERSYTVTASLDLEAPFLPIGPSFSVPSEELDVLKQDSSAAEDAKFYRVEVIKP